MDDENKKQTDDEIRREARQEISEEEFQAQLEVVRKIMRENRDVLKRLAGTESMPDEES